MTKNDLTNDKKMTKKWQKWHHKTGMTKKYKTKWQKNNKKMTKINNQQPSEFAGKIFIISLIFTFLFHVEAKIQSWSFQLLLTPNFHHPGIVELLPQLFIWSFMLLTSHVSMLLLLERLWIGRHLIWFFLFSVTWLNVHFQVLLECHASILGQKHHQALTSCSGHTALLLFLQPLHFQLLLPSDAPFLQLYRRLVLLVHIHASLSLLSTYTLVSTHRLWGLSLTWHCQSCFRCLQRSNLPCIVWASVVINLSSYCL